MRTHRLLVAAALVVSLVGNASASPAQTRPTFDGKVALFGSHHNHSALSDDTVEAERPQLAPLTGWEYPRTHGLDFLAITDHHKAIDSTNNPLRLTEAEYAGQILGAAQTYNQSHLGAFVAVPGIEWGNTATGNHVNVFGAPSLPPDTILGREYDELFSWAAANAEFIQLNHPYSWAGESGRDTTVGNFGEALYSTRAAYLQGLDPAARTMSIISSVAGGDISGALKDRYVYVSDSPLSAHEAYWTSANVHKEIGKAW